MVDAVAAREDRFADRSHRARWRVCCDLETRLHGELEAGARGFGLEIVAHTASIGDFQLGRYGWKS